MNDISCAELPLDPGEPGRQERSHRTNLLLSASIESGSLKAPVRIRNLSETGALLEGASLPDRGKSLTLRRLDLEIGATVVWRAGARCGVKFADGIRVTEWASGTCLAARPGHQVRVDGIQAAVRAGLAPEKSTDAAAGESERADGDLDRRLAEELAHLKRMLELMGDDLTSEPIVVQRHARTLQTFDLASQTLGHLAAILTAEDRAAAVRAIGMEDLRARLLRKPLIRE